MLTNRGFTLIETLFVLAIMCILLTLTMTLHTPVKKEEAYLQEISNFFYEAQLYAMTSKETVKVSVDHQKIIYSAHHIHQEYQLQDGCYFDDYVMTFNEYGHIKSAKTLTYHHFSDVYRFVFQVGSGCFYVE